MCTSLDLRLRWNGLREPHHLHQPEILIMPKLCLDSFLLQWTLHGLWELYFASHNKLCTKWYCATASDFLNMGWSLGIYDWAYCFLGFLHDPNEILRLYCCSDMVLLLVVLFKGELKSKNHVCFYYFIWKLWTYKIKFWQLFSLAVILKKKLG